ncbi:hypothetical protein [Oceanobacillus massiliensis]
MTVLHDNLHKRCGDLLLYDYVRDGREAVCSVAILFNEWKKERNNLSD